MGNHTGPRQFELPPKRLGRGLRGLVVDPVVVAVHAEDVGMVVVVARQGANTVGRKELALRRA